MTKSSELGRRPDGQVSFRGRSSRLRSRAACPTCTAALLAAAVLAATSCGGDSGTGPSSSDSTASTLRRVTSIKFDRKVDTVEVQHANSITVVLQDQKGAVYNASQVDSSAVRISVADTTVATVVPNGLVPQNTGLLQGFVDVVTGLRPGTTLLTFSV